MFARYYETETQQLPQCCKYLADKLSLYLIYAQGAPASVLTDTHTLEKVVEVNDDGFVSLKKLSVVFDIKNIAASTPRQLDHYIDSTRSNLTAHDCRLLKLLARDRWFKGDFVRLRKILLQSNVEDLLKFACNVLWERGYENHYTLGQQLSIRITTKLIQSGLDFKHQNNSKNDDDIVGSRGWTDKTLEKFFNSLTSISDVIKRHKCFKKFIFLELVSDELKTQFKNHYKIVENVHIDNVCAIQLDEDKNSLQYLKKLTHLIERRYVNVLFVTDLEYYMKHNNYMFYLYNSLKLYYYCLKNKFVFSKSDSEIIFLLNLIISLEWHNGGHLNSFTLEKSHIYNPLELSTRRLNSIKRAANQSRTLNNNFDIKIDFIKGKRIKTGTNYGQRIVEIEPRQ